MTTIKLDPAWYKHLADVDRADVDAWVLEFTGQPIRPQLILSIDVMIGGEGGPVAQVHRFELDADGRPFVDPLTGMAAVDTPTVHLLERVPSCVLDARERCGSP